MQNFIFRKYISVRELLLTPIEVCCLIWVTNFLIRQNDLIHWVLAIFCGIGICLFTYQYVVVLLFRWRYKVILSDNDIIEQSPFKNRVRITYDEIKCINVILHLKSVEIESDAERVLLSSLDNFELLLSVIYKHVGKDKIVMSSNYKSFLNGGLGF